MSFLDVVTWVFFWPLALPLKIIQWISQVSENSQRRNELLEEQIKLLKQQIKDNKII